MINNSVSPINLLHVFMSQFKDIDILAINETIKDSKVHLPGCDVIHKDSQSNGRNGGGICICVHSNSNNIIFSFVLILV